VGGVRFTTAAPGGTPAATRRQASPSSAGSNPFDIAIATCGPLHVRAASASRPAVTATAAVARAAERASGSSHAVATTASSGARLSAKRAW
jgi:hypothetical protein